MKGICFFFALFFPLCTFSQDLRVSVGRDVDGTINSVKFPEDFAFITSGSEFFSSFLQVKREDTFKAKVLRSFNPDTRNEYYKQYYKGVLVDGCGFTLHFKNDKLIDAHGHYLLIDDLNVEPTIDEADAIRIFISSNRLAVADTSLFKVKLLIKENFKKSGLPQLVYVVHSKIQSPQNDIVGYINAHTGLVEYTKPLIKHSVATGLFETIYRGNNVQATTERQNNGQYILADYTRGGGIFTKDINSTTSPGSSSLIVDNDNVWGISEHSSAYEYYAFDVHWGIQQFFDRLSYHGINSLDDDGFPIVGYINFPGTDNAGWSSEAECIVIYEHFISYKPFVSVDDIGHELGHGIAHFNIGWDSDILEQASLDEGFSDIWGTILDYRTGASGDEVWKDGDKTILGPYSCIRNFKNPLDAKFIIVDTYGTASYYSESDPHLRGGVFPRWFYLLVNGGEGVNTEIFVPYSVIGVGMDLAEELIVNATFSGRLRNKNSFPDVRDALIETALEMGNTNLATQVQNAWHAVGVGDRKMSISGPAKVCSQAIYTLNNLFQHYSTSIYWSTSNSNLQIISGQGTSSVTVQKQGDGECSLNATVTVYTLHNFYITSSTVYVGNPNLGELRFNASDGGYGYWNGGSIHNYVEILSPMSGFYNQYEFEIYKFDNAWNPALYSHFFSNSHVYEVSLPIGWYLVRARGHNDCTYSAWVEGEVEMQDNWSFRLSYDSSLETLTFSFVEQSSDLAVKNSYSSTQLYPLKFSIEIWNEQQRIKHFSVYQPTYSVSLKGFPSGVYIIRILIDGKTYSRKFVKL